VTGVSKGLGAAFFDEFSKAGDHVLALGRHFTEAQRAKEAAEPNRIRLRPTDLSKPASLPSADEFAEFVNSRVLGDVILVHNAAQFEPFGPIGELPSDEVTAAVLVNLVAPMLLTNALFATEPIPVGGMDTERVPRRNITVVFISSSAAHRVSGGRSVYGSTKRAAEMFFASLEAERGPNARVRVVIADPGVMDTDMQATVREHARNDAYFPGRERFLDRYDRGELHSAAEVARRIISEQLS
jgi:NAD(P)-dependent dehydrogenase (short-subunit alcohol dehydrogenase family)